MVVIMVQYFQLAGEVLRDQLLQLALSENVIVAMVHRRLLVLVLYRCLNEVRLFRLCFFSLLFLFFLICVM